MFKTNASSLLNYLTISQKMVLIFLGSVILPLAIQNSFYYSDTEKNIQSQIMQSLRSSLDDTTNKVSGIISGTITLSHKYNTNEELYKFLDNSYSNDIKYLVEYQDRIEEMLNSDLAYNQNIRKISLYTDNPTVLNGSLVNQIKRSDFKTLGEKLIDYKLYNLTPAENGPKLRISLVPLVIRTSYDRYLSIIRPLKYYSQYSNYQKLLRIDINVSYISSVLENNSIFDNIVLVDTDNRIIASANSFHEFGGYDIFSEDKLKPGIVVLKQPLKDLPLTLYGLYNTKMISNEFAKMRWKTLSIILCSMIPALFCILLVAGNITKRTKQVVNLSKQIAQGNFVQISQKSAGNDEIGILAESMNQMSMKLKTLIDKEYNARILKAQLERETAQTKLLALQSQVNPHFMFNALECIRLKAMAKKETETAEMIMYMSQMFRHLINWNDDITYLKEEIKFLYEFLSIQKYRFDDEFEYSVKVEEGADKCLLPKFIIQPLVENACVHGVEAISNNRYVEIDASLKENKLVVIVSDNGSGISAERLDSLKEMLAGGKKLAESVGLFNVYQRMVLYYGREFTFDVSSELGEGTKITIVVPVRHSKEEFSVLNFAG